MPGRACGVLACSRGGARIGLGSSAPHLSTLPDLGKGESDQEFRSVLPFPHKYFTCCGFSKQLLTSSLVQLAGEVQDVGAVSNSVPKLSKVKLVVDCTLKYVSLLSKRRRTREKHILGLFPDELR